MNPRERIERIFMAAEVNREDGRQDGPYSSAAEAEAQAHKLGWKWVLVYAHVVDDDGGIVDVTRRFYRPAFTTAMSSIVPRTPAMIRKLKLLLSTPDVPPMTAADKTFFATYEKQMETNNGKRKDS